MGTLPARWGCMGMCQGRDRIDLKSLRMDNSCSALWDHAHHQSRVTLAQPNVSHLEQVQPQVGFLLILWVSPFKARAKAAPKLEIRVILPTSVTQGITDAGRVESGSWAGWGQGASCAVGMEGMRKTWIFSICFAVNK